MRLKRRQAIGGPFCLSLWDDNLRVALFPGIELTKCITYHALVDEYLRAYCEPLHENYHKIIMIALNANAVRIPSSLCRESAGLHYNDVIMSTMVSKITSLTMVSSTVYSRRRSKTTSKLRVTGLCDGNPPVTNEFPAQWASNAKNVSIWWRHHVGGFGIYSSGTYFTDGSSISI